MDGADLRDAERLLEGLKKEAREQAENLSSRLRLTGLPATLEWLHVRAVRKGRGELLDRLEFVLGLTRGDLPRLDSAALLLAYDRAARLGDAVHVLVRANRGGR
jgi:hypothetical protein